MLGLLFVKFLVWNCMAIKEINKSISSLIVFKSLFSLSSVNGKQAQ